MQTKTKQIISDYPESYIVSITYFQKLIRKYILLVVLEL